MEHRARSGWQHAARPAWPERDGEQGSHALEGRGRVRVPAPRLPLHQGMPSPACPFCHVGLSPVSHWSAGEGAGRRQGGR